MKNTSARILAGFVALFLCLPILHAQADLVILKNGGQIEGEIIQETEDRLHISTEEQGILALDQNTIERVVRARVRRLPTETPVPDEPTPSATWTVVLPPAFTPEKAAAQPTATFTATMTAAPATMPPGEQTEIEQQPQPEDQAGDGSAPAQPPSAATEETGEFTWDTEEEKAPESINWWYLFFVVIAVLIGQSLFINKCIRIGQERGHSKGFSIFCGIFFGFFGMMLLRLQPGSAKKFAIGCCLTQVLMIACAIFLIVGLIGSAVMAFMGAVEEHRIEDMGYFDEGGYEEIFGKTPTPTEDELLEGFSETIKLESSQQPTATPAPS